MPDAADPTQTTHPTTTKQGTLDGLPPEIRAAAEQPDRNLALELVRITEAAALAGGRWVGRGDKNGADGAAVGAMRALIGTVAMNGVVVIGEGEKDHAPMLFNGERVGDGTGPECDVAVDPIDGTSLCANGQNNAVAVMAVAERGSMYDPSAVFYMEKLVTGPEAADAVDITLSVAENIDRVAQAKNETPDDVTVVILNRPRHQRHRARDHAGNRAQRREQGIPEGGEAPWRHVREPEAEEHHVVGVVGSPVEQVGLEVAHGYLGTGLLQSGAVDIEYLWRGVNGGYAGRVTRELHRPQTGAARELEHPARWPEPVEFLADSLQLEKPPAIPLRTAVVTSRAEKPFVVLLSACPVVG